MLNYSELMTITESAVGFKGGENIDHFPEMTLTECMSNFPYEMAKSQYDSIEDTRIQNEAVVNAVIQSITEGVSVDVTALQEASLDGLMKKISAIFKLIREFISSIIAKIKVAADRLFMNGKKLYAKYKSSPKLSDKANFKGMTYKGYKFTNIDSMFSTASKYDSDISKLIDVGVGKHVPGITQIKDTDGNVTGGQFSDNELPGGAYNKEDKQYHDDLRPEGDVSFQDIMSKHIADIKDTSSEERSSKIVSELTGVHDLGSSWESELKKKLYGEKTTLTYGTDFTAESLGKIIENEKTKTQIIDEYQKLQNSCNKYEADFKRLVAARNKNYDNMTSRANGNTSAINNARANFQAYTEAYLNLIKEAVGLVSKVKNVKWQVFKDQYAQAESIFGAMLTYRTKKESTSSEDDLGMFDFDL